jgi:tetratricopeptide (TPR) repeat protein
MKQKAISRLLLAALLFFHNSSFSQKSKVDSLIAVTSSETDDTSRVNAFNELFLEYEFSDDTKATDALNNALKLSKKINFKKGEAKTYKLFGFFAEDKGNYAEALKSYFASLKLSQEIGNIHGAGASYNGIGAIYFFQKNYPEALKYFNEGLKSFLSANDKSGISTSYNNIGNIYSSQLNYAEARKNLMASLAIDRELGNEIGIAYSYNNIGNLYDNEADIETTEKARFEKLDEALKNHYASLQLKESLHDQGGIASSYGNIGRILIKKREYVKARQSLDKAIELSLKTGDKSCLKNAYNALSSIDSLEGDFKAAFGNYKRYIVYRDSLDNEETRKKTIQNQMTYDFEKKEAVASAEHKKELENQEALAAEQSRKQKIILLFVAAGLLLVLLFAVFIFRSLRITRKQKSLIEKQKDLVERQKQEVEKQKQLVEEHQKEVIDSIIYARRIQRSLLPSDSYIERAMNRLKKKKE